MDAETFDRLSVGFHRLASTATRRSIFRFLLGGSLAATGALLGGQTEAHYKRNKNKYGNHGHNHHGHNNCHGYGAFCGSDHDCCTNNCINNHCYPGNGGGGGQNCNGLNCPDGWGCQHNGSVDVCVPNNYNNCCGGSCYNGSFNCCNGYYGGGACPAGWDCCGFNLCCGSNQHCCGNGRCCPDGWSCNNNGTCDPYNYNAASASAAQAIPSTPAIAITEDQYYKIPAQ